MEWSAAISILTAICSWTEALTIVYRSSVSTAASAWRAEHHTFTNMVGRNTHQMRLTHHPRTHWTGSSE